MSLTFRLGCFFLIVGGLGFILFVASDISHAQQYGVFGISFLLLLIGFILWQKGRSKPRPSGRFRVLGKVHARNEEAPEEGKHDG